MIGKGFIRYWGLALVVLQLCLGMGIASGRENLRDNIRIEEIRVFSLLSVESDYFENLLRTHNQAPGAYSMADLHRLIASLHGHLENMGFPKATIQPMADQRSSESLRLNLYIEDDRPPLFDGAKLLDGGWFRSQQFENVLKSLNENPIDRETTITLARVFEIREIALEFYDEMGWIDAQVELERIRMRTNDEGQKEARLYFRVDRGPRYRIDDVRIENQEKIPSRPFDKVAAWFSGMRYTGKNFRALKSEIQRVCEEHGYMAPDIRIARMDSDKAAHVNLLARVDAGATSSIYNINIIHRPYNPSSPPLSKTVQRIREKVAPRVSRETIERQVRANRGEALDRDVVEGAERRLESMGIFENVKVYTTARDESGWRDLVVELEDKRTAALQFDTGWSDAAGPFGGFQVVEKNMFGQGDQLAFSTRLSRKSMRGQLSYLDRNWDLGDRLMGEDRAPSLSYTAFYLDNYFNEYVEEHIGGSVSLSHRLLSLPKWNNSWRLRLEKIEYDPADDKEDYEEDFEDYIAATAAWHISRDTRRYGDWSQEGQYFMTGLEAGAANGFLAKWNTRYDFYIPIIRNVNWVTKTRLAMLPGSADQVGLADRLQGGGAYDIRGFEDRGIGPVDPMDEDLRIGGATHFSAQNELRWTLYDRLMLVGFFDLGSLSSSAASLNAWREGVGGGFRLKLPQTDGEFFLYLVEPLGSEESDDETSVHFGLSFSF